MPSVAENTSAGLASTGTKILDLTSFVVANGVLGAQVVPMPEWRCKWYAVFVNGRYSGQEYCPMNGDWTFSYMLDAGTELSSFYVVEAGDWDSYDADASIPSGWIEEWEASCAKRLRMTWDSEYRQVGISGDTQLTLVTLLGAVRYLNCQRADLDTHARVYYSLTSNGTSHRVDWWSNGALVATGTSTGDGIMTCSQVNGSGLSATGVLTYTGDFGPSTAFMEIAFPDSFQVHYSTSALTYPRTPEATVHNDGATSFTYLSPVLLGSSYNYNVLAVGDNGIVQASTAAPADSPKSLAQGPKSPTIISVTGDWNAPLVKWTQGENNCYYTLYTSYPNQPINFGEWVSPGISITLTGSTQWNLPPVTNWAPVDRTAIIATLWASMDSAVTTLSAAYVVGVTGFDVAWDAFHDDIVDAYKVFARAIEWNIDPMYIKLGELDSIMQGIISSAGSYGTSWAGIMGNNLARIYQILGVLTGDQPNRWRLAGYDPSTLGESPLYVQSSGTVNTLVGLCDPVILPARCCVVVRATSNVSGIQESGDQGFCFEFDDSGNVIPLAPNQAYIDTYSSTGLNLSVKALYYSHDEEIAPTHLDLYLVASGNAIVPGSPSASVTLGAEVNGERRANIAKTAVASGYYDIAVMARVSTTSSRSRTWAVKTIRLDDAAPDGVTNLKAAVLRGNQ